MADVAASVLARLKNKADLKATIHHWNHVRRQVKLKGLAPVEYRDQALHRAG